MSCPPPLPSQMKFEGKIIKWAKFAYNETKTLQTLIKSMDFSVFYKATEVLKTSQTHVQRSSLLIWKSWAPTMSLGSYLQGSILPCTRAQTFEVSDSGSTEHSVATASTEHSVWKERFTTEHGRRHIGANGVNWPCKMDENLKSENMQDMSSFLGTGARKDRSGRSPRTENSGVPASHLDFRMHHFKVKLSKFSWPLVAREEDPLA